MTKLLSPWKAHNQFKMERPIRDRDRNGYIRWFELDRDIKKKTRAAFINTLNSKSNKQKFSYGIHWNTLINTLIPLPCDMSCYHIDHIIPLTYFNFIHEDESINSIEIKKAWSPANIRVINKELNMKKNTSIDIAAFPLRFEYIFDKEKSNYYYKIFKELREKDKIEYKIFINSIEW